MPLSAHEASENGPKLHVHLRAARASVDAMRAIIATLQRSPNADEKDRASLKLVTQKLDGAASNLESIGEMLAEGGFNSDTSPRGGGGA